MERRFTLAIFVLLQPWYTVADASSNYQSSRSQQIVLVTLGDCCAAPLSSLQLRKLFLGIPVSVDGCQLQPLRNRIDVRLDELFVQAVMSMAPRTYERQLISGLFREGRPRPAEFTSEQLLLEAVFEIPCSVTYMWKQQAEKISNVTIVQVLWKGSAGL